MMKLILAVCLSAGLFVVSTLMRAPTFAQTPSTIASNKSGATQNTSSVNAAQYLLQAASLLYEQKNFSASKNILNAIDTSSLTPDLEQRYVLQQATLAIATNDSAKATVWLNESILTEIPENDIEKQIKLHELRAKTFLLQKKYFDSAKEYLLLMQITPQKDHPAYVDSLWDALSKTDKVTLSNAHLKESSGNLYNWVDLALITKDDSISKENQQAAIKKWFSMRPNHPKPSPLIKNNTK